VAQDVRWLSVVNETEQLARVVLQAANRTQAKGSTARLVFPAAPEIADEMGVELTRDQRVAAEDYLLRHGYVAAANIGLSWGTFTITRAGFSWLEDGIRESSMTDWMRELAERPGGEAAFELALRAELEEERRLIEEVERELGEEPPGDPKSGAEGQEDADLRSGPRTATERRSWWRSMFGA
jgi:hypothetical protein